MTPETTQADAERFRPLRIWKRLDGDRRRQAATAFFRSDAVRREEIEAALILLGNALHFRPQTIRTAPIAKRAGWLAGFGGMNDQLAATLLFAYHLAHQVPMMSRFLDLLGVKHEDARIAEEVKPPEPARLAEAVAALRKEFDPRDVATYFETLISQDDETWGGLAGHLEPGD